MVNVKIVIALDARNPNDNVAISEARKWKALQEKGKNQAYLSEQKMVFMAGIYLHTIAPQLCNKLAQNLADASLDDLEYFNKLIFEKGVNEIQLDGVLDKLGEIQDLINTTIETSRPLSADAVKETLSIAEQEAVLPEVAEIQLNDKLKKIGKIKSKKLF
ncbi:hypothetical protein CXF74_07720 [Psychromonas sp. Urea-02u-13]|nr:hypothetical protein CXF74_07720 [Psychromonas sp. Urea-02u-13]